MRLIYTQRNSLYSCTFWETDNEIPGVDAPLEGLTTLTTNEFSYRWFKHFPIDRANKNKIIYYTRIDIIIIVLFLFSVLLGKCLDRCAREIYLISALLPLFLVNYLVAVWHLARGASN
jgi:hypothetical protein